MDSDFFRHCILCGKKWWTLDSFVADPKITLVGLQAVPSRPAASVMVFLHKGCGSISVKTSVLKDLMGMTDLEAKLENEPCDGCYRNLEELAACEKPCVIAADRRLTLELQKKTSRGG
jgi:hypothetical protein